MCDENRDSWVHVYSGYAVLGLVLLRIVWGLIGTRHARFGDFLYSPRRVVDYIKGLTSSTPQHYLGHNPAGGWMIMALLASLLITSLTGLQVYGLEGYGPLAYDQRSTALVSTAFADTDVPTRQIRYADDDHDQGTLESTEELWEEVHEFFANLTLLLIFVHIIGVLVAGRLHKENLVKAMITGNKQVPRNVQ